MDDTVTTDAATTTGRETAEAGPRPRRVIVHILIVLASVIMLVTAVQVWVDRAILETDNWVETADDLLADPEVRTALATYVVDQLYLNVDLTGRLAEVLPEDLGGLAGPLATALRNPATEAVDRLLSTPQVAQIWSQANERAHQTIVNILRDETNPAFSTTDGVVTLDVREVVVQLAEALGLPGAVVERIPEDAGQIQLAESDTLASLQTAVQIIEVASVVLFIVVVALYGAAVYLATGWRRVATRNVGIAVIVVGLLLLAGLRVGKSILIDEIVVNEANRPIADTIFRIGSELLRDLGWNIAIIGLILVLGAALAGSTRGARAVRRLIGPAFTGAPALRWGIGATVWLILLIWAPLPSLATLWGALLAGVVIALCIEGLHRLCTADQTARLVEPDATGAAAPEEAPVTS